MKKLLIVLLTLAMVLSLAACGGDKTVSADTQEETVPEDAETEEVIETEDAADAEEAVETEDVAETTEEAPALSGGWTAAESPELTEEVQALMDKALSEMVGSEFKAVAYLGSQVVAGTNHAVLCRETPMIERDAPEVWSILVLYEDLEGNVIVSDILSSAEETNLSTENMDGGWALPESPVVTEEVRTAVTEALEDPDMTPLALMSQQVVAGMNYAVLCSYPDGYRMVYVYQPLEGSAELMGSVDFVEALG